MIVVHIRKNSPKRPDAKISIYLQRHRQGISWKFGQIAHGWVRFYRGGNPSEVRYLRF